MKHFQLVIPSWKIFTRGWKWNLRNNWKSANSTEFTACNKQNLKKYCWWGVAESLNFSLSVPCCCKMTIKGSVSGWSPFALSLLEEMLLHTHVCVKCIHRTCKLLQAVSEEEKIYHITSAPLTGHQPRDFVVLVSQRQPCRPQWVF